MEGAEGSWRTEDAAAYVCGRRFGVVTLQFPDELLQHSTRVARELQAKCREQGHAAQFYILADTTYNSLSVDEVAAAHVKADCVIHYGRASLTKLSRLPAFFVFPELALDVEAAAEAIVGCGTVAGCGGAVLVITDQPHLHQLPELRSTLAQVGPAVSWAFADVAVRQLEPERPAPRCAPSGCGAGGAAEREAGAAASCCGGEAEPDQCCQAGDAAAAARAENKAAESSGACELPSSDRYWEQGLAGYTWALPPGVSVRECTFVWVGADDAPALQQLQLTFSAARWVVYDPRAVAAQALREGLPLEISRALRRRYYLVERARNAGIVGILVGTLGVAGYRAAIDAVRGAAQRAGKKTYTLLMGKPSPAKLANFPEVEVFVMVADPQGQVLDCKEYLAPIVTAHEAMLAFDPGAPLLDAASYRLEFDGVIQEGAQPRGSGSEPEEPRFSALDGSFHAREGPGGQPAAGYGDPGTALALRAREALQLTAAAGGRSDLVQPRSAADYLVHKRSWVGVEAPSVGAAPRPVELAVEGRAGRAAGYADEPPQPSCTDPL